MTPEQITQLQSCFLARITDYFPNCFFVEQARNAMRIREDILTPINHPFVDFQREDYRNLAEILVGCGLPIQELLGGRKYQNHDLVDYENVVLNQQYITVYARRMVVPINRHFGDQFARHGQRTIDMFRDF